MFKAIKRRVDQALDTTPRESLRTTSAATRRASHVVTHTSLADMGNGVKERTVGAFKRKAKSLTSGYIDQRDHED